MYTIYNTHAHKNYLESVSYTYTSSMYFKVYADIPWCGLHIFCTSMAVTSAESIHVNHSKHARTHTHKKYLESVSYTYTSSMYFKVYADIPWCGLHIFCTSIAVTSAESAQVHQSGPAPELQEHGQQAITMG